MTVIVGIDVSNRAASLRLVRFNPQWGTTGPAEPLRQMFEYLGVVEIVQSDEGVSIAASGGGNWREIGAALLRSARRALPRHRHIELRRSLADLYSSGSLPWVRT